MSTARIVADIRASLPALSPSGQLVARFFLENTADLMRLTVTDVAKRVGTSSASVVRCCQDLGLTGFQDLKVKVAKDLMSFETTLHDDVRAGDTPDTVLQKVVSGSARALSDAASTLDADAFRQAIGMLAEASHVLVLGVGTSSPLAQDASYKLRTAGVSTEAPIDVHLQHVAASLLRPGSVCFAVSHTGQTRETISAVAAARGAGAGVIALTSFYQSPLTEMSDVALVAASGETDVRVEAVTSRLVHYAVLDAIFVSLSLARPGISEVNQRVVAEAITEHRY